LRVFEWFFWWFLQGFPMISHKSGHKKLRGFLPLIWVDLGCVNMQVVEGKMVAKVDFAFLGILNVELDREIHPQMVPIERVKSSGVSLTQRRESMEISDIRYTIDAIRGGVA
jgi:hypothetical protein